MAAAVFVSLAASAGSTGSAPAPPHSSPSAAGPPATILFVDDDDVIYRPNTRRVMNAAQRSSGVAGLRGVVEKDKIWEAALGYTSVHRADEAERAETGRPRFMLWCMYTGDLPATQLEFRSRGVSERLLVAQTSAARREPALLVRFFDHFSNVRVFSDYSPTVFECFGPL